LLSGCNPLAHGNLGVRERILVRRPVGRTAGQFRNLGKKSLILFTPTEDDFVFQHLSSS
jgi:hypothetical protein